MTSARRRLVEDGGGFDHLDHEGRPAARQIVGRADAREQLVHDADHRALGRHIGTDLGQNGDQRALPKVGGFAGHVGTGDDRDPARGRALRRRQVAGIRHKALALTPQRGLDHRMPAARDLEGEARVDRGPHPAEIGGEVGERGRHVDGGDGARHGFDRRSRFDDARREPREGRKLERQGLFAGRSDLAFELAELDGREAHGVRHGLAMHESPRQGRPEEAFSGKLGDLDEEAEHVVVLDAQRSAVRLIGIARLEGGHDRRLSSRSARVSSSAPS